MMPEKNSQPTGPASIQKIAISSAIPVGNRFDPNLIRLSTPRLYPMTEPLVEVQVPGQDPFYAYSAQLEPIPGEDQDFIPNLIEFRPGRAALLPRGWRINWLKFPYTQETYPGIEGC